MIIRLGYACITNSVDGTSSTPFTFKEYNKDKDLNKLDKVIISNLDNLSNIIDYNIKNNIHFYRLSSKIIPLATLLDFDYINKYKTYYEKISYKIKKNKLRVDLHPDQFCVLNSTKENIVNNSINILKYHYNILNALNIDNKTLVLHVGSSEDGKDISIKRFINNYNKLPLYLKDSIALENDDKIYNINDVIYISKRLEIPVILDYHHHLCNSGNIDFDYIFKSWKGKRCKMHFSTPKNKKEFRAHNDYIDSDSFIKFIDIIKEYKYDLDIMIEAKAKDDAMFRLIRELKYKTNFKFIDDTTFIPN